ncbi:MAG: metal-dependent hydrolase [Elusimicrobia bacterium]|nr:metal-dependent hydrolase [Elusimicrobiota bacterium]
MDPIAHCLLGALIGKSFGFQRRSSLWLAAGLAELPDIDVFSWAIEGAPMALVHRAETTHSFAAAIALAVPAGWLFVRRESQSAWRGFAAAVALLCSHVTGDWLTTYGTPVFWPFDRSNFSLDLVSNLNWLPIILISAGLVFSAFGSRRAIQAAWLSLALFVLCSGSLRLAARRQVERAHPELLFSVFPHILAPWVFRAVGEGSDEYQTFVVSPLQGTIESAGVFPKAPPVEPVQASLATASTRLFLKHNRWPVAKIETAGNGTRRVIWGNLLFSRDGRMIHGRAVAEVDAQGRLLRHWRDGKLW